MQFSKALLTVSLSFVWFNSASSQEISVTTEVTYLAGPNTYVNIGRDEGLNPGDTLSVSRSDISLGIWLTISASSTRAVIKSTDGVTVEVGDVLVISFRPRSEPEQRNTTVVERDSSTVSIMQISSEQTRPSRVKNRPAVRGRVSSNVSGSFSETTSILDPGQQTHRTSVIPSLSLNLRTVNIDGVDASLNARVSHRYSDPSPFDNPTTVRLYSATLTKSLPHGMSVLGGRFANRDGPFPNYWDGISLSTGTSFYNFGVAAGFQPDRFNEGFVSSLPKYSLFAGTSTTMGRTTYDAKVSFTDVRATDSESHHIFAGIKHRLALGRSRVESEFQVNRDPLDREWKVVRFGMATSLFFLDRNMVKLDYDQRKSFSVWSTTGLPEANRVRLLFSYAYSGSARTFRLSTSRNKYGQQSSINSYMGSFSLRKLPYDLSFSTYGTYWHRTDLRGYSYSASLSHSLTRGTIGLRYRVAGSDLASRTLINHSIAPSWSYRFGRSVVWTSQLSMLSGDALSNYSFFTSLSVRI